MEHHLAVQKLLLQTGQAQTQDAPMPPQPPTRKRAVEDASQIMAEPQAVRPKPSGQGVPTTESTSEIKIHEHAGPGVKLEATYICIGIHDNSMLMRYVLGDIEVLEIQHPTYPTCFVTPALSGFITSTLETDNIPKAMVDRGPTPCLLVGTHGAHYNKVQGYMSEPLLTSSLLPF